MRHNSACGYFIIAEIMHDYFGHYAKAIVISTQGEVFTLSRSDLIVCADNHDKFEVGTKVVCRITRMHGIVEEDNGDILKVSWNCDPATFSFRWYCDA